MQACRVPWDSCRAAGLHRILWRLNAGCSREVEKICPCAACRTSQLLSVQVKQCAPFPIQVRLKSPVGCGFPQQWAALFPAALGNPAGSATGRQVQNCPQPHSVDHPWQLPLCTLTASHTGSCFDSSAPLMFCRKRLQTVRMSSARWRSQLTFIAGGTPSAAHLM